MFILSLLALLVGIPNAQPAVAAYAGRVLPSTQLVDPDSDTNVCLDIGHNLIVCTFGLQAIAVSEGEIVAQGQLLGYRAPETEPFGAHARLSCGQNVFTGQVGCYLPGL